MDSLASAAEKSLTKLGFVFFKSSDRNIVEFLVREPARFRVTVESASRIRVGTINLVGQETETVFGIWPDLEDQERGEAARACASRFIAELINSLSTPPWKGMGVFRSRTEKGKWLRLAEI